MESRLKGIVLQKVHQEALKIANGNEDLRLLIAHTQMLDALALHAFNKAEREPHNLPLHVSTDALSLKGDRLNSMTLDTVTQKELRENLQAMNITKCTDAGAENDLSYETEGGDTIKPDEVVLDSAFCQSKKLSTTIAVTELRLDEEKDEHSVQALHLGDEQVPLSTDHMRAQRLSIRRTGHSGRGNHLHPHHNSMET
jgi:hypothetical protein